MFGIGRHRPSRSPAAASSRASYLHAYPLWVTAAVVAAVLSLLIIRIACEFLCVVFNIATHLSELRQSLPEGIEATGEL